MVTNLWFFKAKSESLEKLKRELPKINLSIHAHQSLPELSDLLNSQYLSSGKRFRALLFLINSNMFHTSPDEVLAFARILELIHSATLVHDDVMDQAPRRRDKDTINHLKSNSAAILCGDFLIAQVMKETAAGGRLDILKELSGVVEDLVVGQYMELESQGVLHQNWDRQIEIARLKTGSLVRSCFSIPGRLASLDLPTLKALELVGEKVGVAFQIQDDILDFSQNTGKASGQDLAQGMMNFVSIQLLRDYPQLKDELREVFGAEHPEIPQAWPLPEVCLKLRAYSKALLREATDQVERIQDRAVNEEARKYLRQVIEKLGDRTK
ncbi:MAG: polyprenyl synthetase family protein [Bradymonadales bacterium]|nr:MAG: polyprenyl synthetase family protein [Bradymonadales bacterium]